MTHEENAPRGVVTVSRVVEAPAARIFELLADPVRHPEFDGSRNLRAATDPAVITAVGERFGMRLYHDEIGEYEVENHVVEFERDRSIAWEPAPCGEEASGAGVVPGVRPGQRWSYVLRVLDEETTEITETYDCSRATRQVRERVGDGAAWVRSMEKSLERLDRLVRAT